jgi:hypothetical protein
MMIFHLFYSIIENKLWKGKNGQLTISGKAFQNKIGWSSTTSGAFILLLFIAVDEFICRSYIFKQLGFELITRTEAPGTPEERTDEYLSPPNTEPNSPEGQEARMKLLRFWVETNAYLVDYQRRFGEKYCWFPVPLTHEAQHLHLSTIRRTLLMSKLTVPVRCTSRPSVHTLIRVRLSSAVSEG